MRSRRLGQDLADLGALLLPCRDERIERRREAVPHVAMKGLRRRLAFSRLRTLDDAAHREQAIKRSRPQIRVDGDLGKRGNKRIQRRAVDPDLGPGAGALRRERSETGAAGRAASAMSARMAGSSASKPGGRRSRRSKPLALTVLISQAQVHSPDWPACRAKPVMLASGVAYKRHADRELEGSLAPRKAKRAGEGYRLPAWIASMSDRSGRVLAGPVREDQRR